MNRKTAVAAVLGCAVLAAPVGASTSPQASEERVVDVADSSLVATASEASGDPVVVPAAATVREWSKAAAATSTNPEQVPTVVLDAYTTAVAVAPASCNMTVPLLAAVGQVESGNLVGRSLDAGHAVTPAIIGPRLDGGAFRQITDTDGGRLDGDKEFDRAVGPMQFLPSTWRSVGVDMDGDGTRDPQNVYDAAGAAMVYLCGARDLSDPAQLRQAILSYNRSQAYVQQVLTWKTTFETKGLGATASLPIFTGSATAVLAGGSGTSGTSGTGSTTVATGQTGGKPLQPGKPRPGKAGSPSASPSGSPSASPSGTPSGVPSTPGTPSGVPSTPGTPSGTPSTPGTPSPTGPGTPATDPSPTPGTDVPSPGGTPSASPGSGPAVLVSTLRELLACASPGAVPAEVPVTLDVFAILVFADVDKTLAAFPDGDPSLFSNDQDEVEVSLLCKGP